MNIVPGNKNVIYKPLLDRRNINLPLPSYKVRTYEEFCESYGQEWGWLSIFKT
jgi:hypothetical protein